MRRLTAIWLFDGANYNDWTQVSGDGTASLTVSSGQTLYLGSDDWLAGVLAFMSAPPTPTPNYNFQQSNGDTWVTIPLEESLSNLESGVQLLRGSLFWGISPAPWRLLSFSSTFPETGTPVDTTPRYWVRLQITSGSITIDRLLPQMFNTYASIEDMEGYIGYQFDDVHAPTRTTVRNMLRANDDWLDNYTRRSWRPRVAFNEGYDFNPYGFKLRKYPPWFVISCNLWNGSTYDFLTEGRGENFWVDSRTGMLRFTLPSFRLQYYSFLLSRYMRQPNSVQVTYVYGADYETSDVAEDIKMIVLKKTGADLVTQNDWTAVFTRGTDNVPKPEKMKAWREEAVERAAELRLPLVT